MAAYYRSENNQTEILTLKVSSQNYWLIEEESASLYETTKICINTNYFEIFLVIMFSYPTIRPYCILWMSFL